MKFIILFLTFEEWDRTVQDEPHKESARLRYGGDPWNNPTKPTYDEENNYILSGRLALFGLYPP